MSDDAKSGWDLAGSELWSFSIGPVIEKSPHPVRFKVSGSLPAPGKEDMDWTEPFLERGTTFTLGGSIASDPIPIEEAYVKDEVLHFWGFASWGDAS